jgi:uncharacterized integral membrane protein
VVTQISNQLQMAPSRVAEATTPTPAVARPGRGRLHSRRSRVSGLSVAVVFFALVLLVLLSFVLSNGQRSDVYFLGAHGSPPMGVALLLSAIFGALFVTLPAAVRIAQSRLVTGRRRDGTVPQPTMRSHIDRHRRD